MRFVCVLLGLVGARVAQTPTEKVVQMLRDLQNQVEEEGKAEAKTYDKFACFCKSKTAAKTEAIKEGEIATDKLVSALEGFTSRRNELNLDIDGLNANIKTYQGEIEKSTDMRSGEKATFDAAFADMTKAVSSLERAIATLKSSKPSLISIKTMVRDALLTADALDIAVNKKVVTALLSGDGFGVPVSDYDFHSNRIVEVLEQLLDQFRGKKTDLERENTEAQSQFDLALQAKQDQVKATQLTLEEAQKERTKTTENIASSQQDLTEKNAVLNDDRVYLKDLTTKCENKANEWDQRSTMRADELSALTQALTVLEGTVAKQAQLTGAGGREAAKPEVEAVQEDDEDEEVSFAQLAAVRKSEPEDMDTRQRLATILTAQGKKLKSAALATLATRVMEDPFVKVKGLIQTLIERLLQEEADEANHKGWCDTEIAKTVKTRDNRLRDVTALHNEIEELESRRAVLLEDQKDLKKAIADLTSDFNEQKADRDEESAEHEQTVKDAEEGQKAVQQAIDILSHFYGAAAIGNRVMDLVQASKGVDDDAPDTGFEGDYKGSQSASTGILGMLDVINSDFARTIKETTAAEEQAQRDFVEFDRETQVSLKTKNVALRHTETELRQVSDRAGDAVGELRDQQLAFDNSVKEWEELLPQCVADPGMTYAERVQRREDEIAALKQAYCVLNNEDADCTGVFLQKRSLRH